MGTLSKNTLYYTSALAGQKLLAFLYFTFIARALGPEKMGEYVTALSFTALFSVLVDVGLSPYLIRETAKKERDSSSLVASIIALKVPLAFIVYAVAVMSARALQYPPDILRLIALSGIVMVLDSFSVTFWAILRGRQIMTIESVTVVLFQILLVAGGGAALLQGYGPFALMLVLVGASSFQFFVSAWAAFRYEGRGIRSAFLRNPFGSFWGTFRSLIKVTLPFALAGIFTRIFTSFDTVMISKMVGEEAVGWYSIPVKVTLAFQFIPMAFVASLYPAMSSAYGKWKRSREKNTGKEQLERLFSRAVTYLAILGFPIGFGIAALAREIITLVWTEAYLPAVPALRVLLAGLVVLFLSFPLGSLLNASDRQMKNTKHIGIMLAVNIALNAVLIPLFGITGAALASFASSLLLLVLNGVAVRQVIKIPFSLYGMLARIFAIAAVMAVLAVLFSRIHLFVGIAAAAVWYGTALFLSGVLRREDFSLIFSRRV